MKRRAGFVKPLACLVICIAVSGALTSCSTSTGVEDVGPIETRVSTTRAANTAESEQATMNQSAENPSTRERQSARGMPVASVRALNAEVSAGESIEIEFSIENADGPEVRLLPWGSPMESELTAPVFNIVRIDLAGESTDVAYGGVMIKRAPPTDSDYVVLPTGGRLVNTFLLDDSYSLGEAGTYHISFAPPGLSSDNVFPMGDTEVSIQGSDITIVRN